MFSPNQAKDPRPPSIQDPGGIFTQLTSVAKWLVCYILVTDAILGL